MKKIFLSMVIALTFIGCRENQKMDFSDSQENKLLFSSFKTKFTKSQSNSINGRVMPTESLIGDEEVISYEIGEFVGDLKNDLILDGDFTIKAITDQEEQETKEVLLNDINNAKEYLMYHGLDFSDEYSTDDHRYLLAALLVKDMENTVGIPDPDGSSNNNTSRMNTVSGCVLQAMGITTMYDMWYGKFATKRLLLRAVGKLATRYLGYVGAAIAVIDFADCMWGE